MSRKINPLQDTIYGCKTFTKPIGATLHEQDKSSDIEQQPNLSAIANKFKAIYAPNDGVIQKQREHHIIKTKYAAVHPTYVSDNNKIIKHNNKCLSLKLLFANFVLLIAFCYLSIALYLLLIKNCLFLGITYHFASMFVEDQYTIR